MRLEEGQLMIKKEMKEIYDRRIKIKKEHLELTVELEHDSNNEEIKNRIKALEEEIEILKKRNLELFEKL